VNVEEVEVDDSEQAPEYIGWPQGKIAGQPKVVDATGRLGEGCNLFGTL
jgi:hypothetical protein